MEVITILSYKQHYTRTTNTIGFASYSGVVLVGMSKALPTFCKEHLAWFPVLPIHGIEYATGCPLAGFPRDYRVATVSDASGKIKQQRSHITIWQFWKFREGGWYGGGSCGGGLKVDGSVGWVGGWARGQRLPWRVDWWVCVEEMSRGAKGMRNDGERGERRNGGRN